MVAADILRNGQMRMCFLRREDAKLGDWERVTEVLSKMVPVDEGINISR